jgi:hypothetical protein
MSNTRYRLVPVSDEFAYTTEEKNEDGPYYITIKNMAGDLLVLSTGNGRDSTYDENEDTVSNLYSLVAKHYGIQDMFKISLIDSEQEDDPRDLEITVFKYLDDKIYTHVGDLFMTHKAPHICKTKRCKSFHGPDSDYGRTKYRVMTPLPRRNLVLYLLITDGSHLFNFH